MSKILLRAAISALAFFGLLTTLAPATAPVALAQTPSSVRVLHVPAWYSQQQPTLPFLTNNLKYYGGQVMVGGSNTFAIFWVPAGFTVDAKYKSLIERYFNDIGGSSFFRIVTQYYENPGKVKIANHSVLAGTFMDTTPYPGGRGTAANPLTDSDIHNEVLSVSAAKGWAGGTSNLYFVFTAKGVESCLDANDCTPGTTHPVFCAYHGYFLSGSVPYLYANMPYAATWGANCGTFNKSPNHDRDADTEISITSHEHFEAVTDLNPPPLGPIPGTTAWTDKNGFEIGDKCAFNYGGIASDGHNIKLNGHPYIMQLEWSNKVSHCANSY